MADSRITDLTSGNPAQSGDEIPINRSGADRKITAGSIAALATGDVPSTRQIISGAGLTGGGTLAADRTLVVGAGTGITVNADDVALTVPVAVSSGGTGQTTEAEAVGELTQALTEDTAPAWADDYLPFYDGASDTGKKFKLTTVTREILAADRDYYVRTDGSDSNTGLVNSSGGAFLTIQKAIDSWYTLDTRGYATTINIGAGTFAGFSVEKAPPGGQTLTVLYILGTAGPGGINDVPDTIITEGGDSICAAIYHCPCRVRLELLTFAPTIPAQYGVWAENSRDVRCFYCCFDGTNAIQYGLSAVAYSSADGQSCIFKGTFDALLLAQDFSICHLFTYTNLQTPTCNVAVMQALNRGSVAITGGIDGSATGPKYDIRGLCSATTDAADFPGTTAGIANAASQVTTASESRNLSFGDNRGLWDDVGNEYLIFQKTASAVNHWEMTNAASGNSPQFGPAGAGTDLNADIVPKGTGVLRQNTTPVALTGKQTIYIPAAAMTSRTTSGAQATSREINSITIAVLAFDTAADEGANFHIAFPKSWNAGTITYQAFWTAASSTGTVEFELRGGSFANDAAINVSGLGTAVAVSDTLLATNDVHVTSESSAVTLSNPAADTLSFFEIIRDVSDDTLGADAELIGIKFFYTTSVGNDA